MFFYPMCVGEASFADSSGLFNGRGGANVFIENLTLCCMFSTQFLYFSSNFLDLLPRSLPKRMYSVHFCLRCLFCYMFDVFRTLVHSALSY